MQDCGVRKNSHMEDWAPVVFADNGVFACYYDLFRKMAILEIFYVQLYELSQEIAPLPP